MRFVMGRKKNPWIGVPLGGGGGGNAWGIIDRGLDWGMEDQDQWAGQSTEIGQAICLVVALHCDMGGDFDPNDFFI